MLASGSVQRHDSFMMPTLFRFKGFHNLLPRNGGALYGLLDLQYIISDLIFLKYYKWYKYTLPIKYSTICTKSTMTINIISNLCYRL